MVRFFKTILFFLGTLALLLAIGATWVHFASRARLDRSYSVTPRPVALASDPAALARGQHLAQTRGCNECHGKDFAGNKVIEDGAMGRVHGSNLTRGTGGRVATWTDTDWVRAIRHGVAPDGRALFLMPADEYQFLSDDDLGALIAYLKSVPAVDRENVRIELGPVARVLVALGKIKLAASIIDHPNVKPVAVASGVTPEYGRYVAATCMGCHGPNFSGGKIEVGPPNWPEASNLTSHASGNVAKWTEADFLQALRAGKRPDGTEINPIMPRVFGQMDDTELKAIWAYLRTVPAVPKGAR
jgi:cytochrome c553